MLLIYQSIVWKSSEIFAIFFFCKDESSFMSIAGKKRKKWHFFFLKVVPLQVMCHIFVKKSEDDSREISVIYKWTEYRTKVKKIKISTIFFYVKLPACLYKNGNDLKALCYHLSIIW